LFFDAARAPALGVIHQRGVSGPVIGRRSEWERCAATSPDPVAWPACAAQELCSGPRPSSSGRTASLSLSGELQSGQKKSGQPDQPAAGPSHRAGAEEIQTAASAQVGRDRGWGRDTIGSAAHPQLWELDHPDEGRNALVSRFFLGGSRVSCARGSFFLTCGSRPDRGRRTHRKRSRTAGCSEKPLARKVPIPIRRVRGYKKAYRHEGRNRRCLREHHHVQILRFGSAGVSPLDSARSGVGPPIIVKSWVLLRGARHWKSSAVL